MVFEWTLYFAQLAEEIRWWQDQRAELVSKLEATRPTFRNIAYPLSTTPLVIRQEWHQQHQQNTRHYLSILEKTIRLCIEHPEVSEYLGHSEIDRRFVLTPLSSERYITICRLDGYIQRNTGRLKVLEHNSDSPAGIVFSPRLNGMVRMLWQELGEFPLDTHLADKQFDDPRQTQMLFASFAPANPEFVILQESGKSSTECREMAQAFSLDGLPSRVGDPQEVRRNGREVWLKDRRVNIIWNKINTVYWREFMKNYPDQAEQWLAILRESEVCHLNHFGARLVTENKRCLSLLQEERFAHFYDAEEHRVIRNMLPWTSKFEAGKRVRWQGERIDLVTLAQREQQTFVIKEPYDIRGDGVTIGHDCTTAEWEQKIRQAVNGGYVLQEYIAPLQMPVCHASYWSPVRSCNLSLDTFQFLDTVAGYGAKASTQHRVNLFKGGRKIAVFVGK